MSNKIYITMNVEGEIQVFNNEPIYNTEKGYWQDITTHDYFSTNGEKGAIGLILTKSGLEKLKITDLSFENCPQSLPYSNIEELFKNIKLIPIKDFKITDSMHFVFETNSGFNDKDIVVEKPTSYDEDSMLFHYLMGYRSESDFINTKEIKGIGYPNGSVQLSGWSSSYISFQEISKEHLKAV